MQSTDYLVQHALEHVWCRPMEDEQSTVQLSRLTGINGSIGEVTLFYETIDLPTERDAYHVYMIGGNHPHDFTLPESYGQWVNMKMWCAQNQLLAYFYTDEGKLFPLTDVYMMREEDENIIFAVKEHKLISDLNAKDLYVHFYHNEYWMSELTSLPKDQILISGGEVGYVNYRETLAKVNELTTANDFKFNIFHNGKLNFQPKMNFHRNDTVELIRDGSIVRDVWVNVGELPTFASKLDNTQKYYVHIPKLSHEDPMYYKVFYHDDVDIHLVKIPDLKPAEEGGHLASVIEDSRYYYKHNPEAIRMMTHQTYSLPVDYVHHLIRKSGSPSLELDKWYLRIQIRNSGTKHTLQNEKHHIRELYRLPDDLIVEAMIGPHSTVEHWQAANIEASMYTYLMRAYRHEITKDAVLDAYGYVNTAHVLANPNIGITNDATAPFFILPVGLANECTVFEYDVKGRLIDFHHHKNNFRYFPNSKRTTYIEAFSGKGSSRPEYYINPPATLGINPQSQYRAYVSPIINEVVTGEWKDVTLDATKWERGEETAFPRYNRTIESMVVIGDNHWLAYHATLKAEDGVYDFGIYRLDTVLPLPIPYGKIDLWLNGYSLVEGIDYVMDYPNIVILTKEYFIPEEEQRLTIRGLGYCNREMKRITPREYGFTAHGKISVDQHFDLHDEAVSRISINGGIINPMNLTFSMARGEAEVPAGIVDGRPFAVEEHYIPLKSFIGNNVYQEYENDLVRFETMSNYLESKLGIKAPTEKVIIKHRYRLYSPTMANLIYHILTNKINVDNVQFKDKRQMEKVMKPFMKWLKVDLAALGWDEDFMLIEPFPGNRVIDLTYKEYAFLEAVNSQFLNNAVDLTPWVNVVLQRG